MDKFRALPEEKRKTVIDAAMLMFGRVGYKKASVNDIAVAAGISKGMVFHYFGSKKRMYLYLLKLAFDSFMEGFGECDSGEKTDFFDRVLYTTQIKLSILRKHPALLPFLTSVYLEEDCEVRGEIHGLLGQGETFRAQMALTDIDVRKFKDTVCPELVLKLLVRCGEGYVSNAHTYVEFDVDSVLKEFTDCVHMMRDHFYKEEYL